MIPDNYFYVIVVLMAFGTVAIRGSFIAFSGRITISPKIRTLFTYIPAAIFPALIVPGASYSSAGLERFYVLIAAAIFCFFVRNTLAVISFGLISLYFLNYLKS